MTRNMTRFLAGSLLSLAPSSVLAGPVDFAFPDLLSQHDEYVSVREWTLQVPPMDGAPVESLGPALEDFFVFNQTGVDVHLGIVSLTGTLNGVYSPYPVPTGSPGGFQVSAPTPPLVQHYYWTVDPGNPAGAKTCLWRVEVMSASVGCTALVTYASYGGAICTLALGSSGIDPTTCAMRLATYIQ